MSVAAETFIRAIRHSNDLITEYISRGEMTWNNIEFLFNTLVEGQPKPEFYKTDAFMEAFNAGGGFKHLGKLLSNWNNMKSTLFRYIKPNEKIEIIYSSHFTNLPENYKNLTGKFSKIMLIVNSYIHIFSLKPMHHNNSYCIYGFNNSILPSSQSIQYHEIILEIIANPINNYAIITNKFWRHLYDYMWLDIPKVLWDNYEIRNLMLRDTYIKDYSKGISLGISDFHNYILPLETELKSLKTMIENLSKTKKISVKTKEEDPPSSLPILPDGGAGGGGAVSKATVKTEPIFSGSEDFRSLGIVCSIKMSIKEWRPILGTILRDGEGILFIGDKEYVVNNDFKVFEVLNPDKLIGSVIFFNNELLICK
jgi:hypothetical protein